MEYIGYFFTGLFALWPVFWMIGLLVSLFYTLILSGAIRDYGFKALDMGERVLFLSATTFLSGSLIVGIGMIGAKVSAG